MSFSYFSSKSAVASRQTTYSCADSSHDAIDLQISHIASCERHLMVGRMDWHVEQIILCVVLLRWHTNNQFSHVACYVGI